MAPDIDFMLLGVFLYLLLAATGSALWLLPPLRAWAVQRTRGCWERGCALGAGLARRWRGGAGALRHGARTAVAASTQQLQRHAWALAAGLGVVAVVPLAAWSLRGMVQRPSQQAQAVRLVDERVAALLQGEQLVPPPALPPALFSTPEVESWVPMARQASRQWELLEPGFRQRLLLVFRLMQERHGYDMVLVEGYRSPERQAALAALGPSVTRAGPFESRHQYGLAADCAFLRGGKVVISERDPWAMRGYAAYGEVARSLGLIWGGDWRSPKDYGHVEFRPSSTGASQ